MRFSNKEVSVSRELTKKEFRTDNSLAKSESILDKDIKLKGEFVIIITTIKSLMKNISDEVRVRFAPSSDWIRTHWFITDSFIQLSFVAKTYRREEHSQDRRWDQTRKGKEHVIT